MRQLVGCALHTQTYTDNFISHTIKYTLINISLRGVLDVEVYVSLNIHLVTNLTKLVARG